MYNMSNNSTQVPQQQLNDFVNALFAGLNQERNPQPTQQEPVNAQFPNSMGFVVEPKPTPQQQFYNKFGIRK